jgi:hypothetical protein
VQDAEKYAEGLRKIESTKPGDQATADRQVLQKKAALYDAEVGLTIAKLKAE